MLGTRTETKNVNSFRSVERAVRYEMQRHGAVLSSGTPILQETRHWHEDTGVTTSGREKSDADDYRYFPEPDLVPVAPSREWVDELRGTLPENPTERRARLQAEWGFSDLEMRDTIGAGALALIEETVAAGTTPQTARKWWLGEFARRANDQGVEISELGVGPSEVAAVQALVDDGTLNDKLARQVFDGLFAGEGTPQEIVAARGLAIVSDEGALSDRRRQRDRRQPGRRRQDPGGQGRRGGCPDRCGDEGDGRPGRRRPGARADPGEARLASPTQPAGVSVPIENPVISPSRPRQSRPALVGVNRPPETYWASRRCRNCVVTSRPAFSRIWFMPPASELRNSFATPSPLAPRIRSQARGPIMMPGDRGSGHVDRDPELEALLVPGDLGQGDQEPVGRDGVEVGVAHVRTIPPRRMPGAGASGVGCEPHDKSIHIHARGGGSRSKSGADPQP